MIIAIPTKYGTGVEIYGDYYDLKSIHNTLHEICRLIDDEGETPEINLYYSLAYEVRKAYDGHREIYKNSDFDEANNINYKGFKIYWHQFIVTINLLRRRIGYINSNYEHQANIYRLEYLAISCLKEYDLVAGELLCKWITEYQIHFDNLIQLKIDEITIKHLSEKNGKKRFSTLFDKLRIFLPLSKEHMFFADNITKIAEKHNCKVEELETSEEIINQINYKW